MCYFGVLINMLSTLIALQLLDMVLESYFDGRLFKNKIWVGTVEGHYLSGLNFYLIDYFLKLNVSI